MQTRLRKREKNMPDMSVRSSKNGVRALTESEKSKKYIHTKPRPLLIGGDQILGRYTGKMQPYPVILESTAQQLVRAHLTYPPQLPSLARLVQQRR